jgi:hypothetical protein
MGHPFGLSALKSLNLNVLDLGFFIAIQYLQQKKTCSTIADFIQVVEESFAEYPLQKVIQIFLTLESVMVAVDEAYGVMTTKFLTVLKKGFHIRQGTLLNTLKCAFKVFEQAKTIVAKERSAIALSKQVLEQLRAWEEQIIDLGSQTFKSGILSGSGLTLKNFVGQHVRMMVGGARVIWPSGTG